jgi:hypothetical protein
MKSKVKILTDKMLCLQCAVTGLNDPDEIVAHSELIQNQHDKLSDVESHGVKSDKIFETNLIDEIDYFIRRAASHSQQLIISLQPSIKKYEVILSSIEEHFLGEKAKNGNFAHQLRKHDEDFILVGVTKYGKTSHGSIIHKSFHFIKDFSKSITQNRVLPTLSHAK